jgi:hypothetical protein
MGKFCVKRRKLFHSFGHEVPECPKPSADFFPGHATTLAQNPKYLSETSIYLIDGTDGPAHIRDQRDISLSATLLPCSGDHPRRCSLECRRRDYFLIALSDGRHQFVCGTLSALR